MKKNKFLKTILPCIVLAVFIGVFIAASVVYFKSYKNKSVTIENGELTVETFNGYIDKISDELKTDADGIMLVNSGRFEIYGGNINKVLLEVCVNRGGETAYYQIQSGGDTQGVNLIYIDTAKADGDIWTISLPMAAEYLKGINGALPLTAYTAITDYSCNCVASSAICDGYIWQDDHFKRVLLDTYGLFNTINVTDDNAKNYVFFIN
ncbi:MAG: hypothetical protein LUD27_07505 [Clostridia bacterium]|nr:hypothetical protein [Clostridia bacterium]